MAGRNASVWERVDERVLQWVATPGPSLDDTTIYDFRSNATEPDTPIEGLDATGMDNSLSRLARSGFISGRNDNGLWWRIRVAPRGLVYLGEWPDLELVATAVTLRQILHALAQQAPNAERDAVTRAAGIVGRTGDAVLRETLAEVAHDVGSELG